MNAKIDEINDGLAWCGIQVEGAEVLAERLAAATDPAAELAELACTGRRHGIQFHTSTVRDTALFTRDIERSLRISHSQAAAIAANVQVAQH